MNFPIKGVMMDANGGTYEEFAAAIDHRINVIINGNTVDLNGKTPKYGGIPALFPKTAASPPLRGFDMHFFLTDIASRMEPNAPAAPDNVLGPNLCMSCRGFAS